jgi:O-antigen/teichoic acid export membrane protein
MANHLLSYLKGRFSKGSFAKNVLTVSTGIVMGQVLYMAAAPIITRLYGPDDLGILGVYGSLLAIFASVSSLRYVFAIPLPKSDVAAANLCVLCLFTVLITSIFSGLLTWLWGERFLALVAAQAMGPYIWLLPLGVLGAGSYEVLTFWGIRQKAFRTIAWTKISQNLGRATTMIGLGCLSLGPVGLLMGEIVGQSSGATRLALFAWRNDKVSFQHIEVKRVFEVLSRYKKFPLFSLQSLLTVLANKVPALLLATFYGLQVVGWFTLAQWVFLTPITLIQASISQVYQGELAQLARKSPTNLSKLYFKTLKALSLVALAIVPLIVFSAPWIISSVFGQQWHEAGAYIQVLSPMYLFQLIGAPLFPTLDILERQDLGMAKEILRVILVAVTIPLAAAQKQPAVIAILFYGIAAGIGYFFGIAATWYAIATNATNQESQVLLNERVLP